MGGVLIDQQQPQIAEIVASRARLDSGADPAKKCRGIESQQGLLRKAKLVLVVDRIVINNGSGE